MDTPRTWELVLPMLERRYQVLLPTLTGHLGGPPLQGDVTASLLPDAVERAMDDAGLERAHIVGNSLGGWVSLQLAARGRAESVVALAPAGGWAKGDDSRQEKLSFQQTMHEAARSAAPRADEIAATPEGRRRATEMITVNFEHIPADLIAHQIRGVAGCDAAAALIAFARGDNWELDAARIDCPVRIVWGTEDRLLAWPSAAARFRDEWLPNADWVVLDGVGHCPQLDVPLETAELITSFTSR